MAIKKTTTTKKIKSSPKKTRNSNKKYYEAVGRRKSSVARVRIFPVKETDNSEITINNKSNKEYLPTATLQRILEEPLSKLKLKDKFNVIIKVIGGGISGQAQASSLGIARALIAFDPELKSILKLHKLITRDAREKERKHIGKRGARRGQQWSKR